LGNACSPTIQTDPHPASDHTGHIPDSSARQKLHSSLPTAQLPIAAVVASFGVLRWAPSAAAVAVAVGVAVAAAYHADLALVVGSLAHRRDQRLLGEARLCRRTYRLARRILVLVDHSGSGTVKRKSYSGLDLHWDQRSSQQTLRCQWWKRWMGMRLSLTAVAPAD